MSISKFKRFIAFFSTIIILMSFILPNFDGIEYLAATVITSTTETTKKKTVGHKIEGAEYYDELWNKFSVIAIDNGGGSGEGGGAGDNNSKNAGNSGQYNDAGGTFGHAAGQGLGTGNTANQPGQGSGTNGGSTGSVKADALRALKTQIEESRAESIRRVLETAKNAESVAASIAERESIQSSIQKRMQQESIKAKIAQPETQKQYETQVYIEETVRRNQVMPTTAETMQPTSTEKAKNYFDNNTKPTPVYVEEYEIVIEEKQQVTLSEFEPGDFVAETLAKNRITNNVNQSLVNSPTSDIVETEIEISPEATPEHLSETVPESTLKVFDAPIIEEETSVAESEAMSENPTELDEQIDASDEEDGKGSKGGEDAEKEEDMTGDAGENESEGNADDRGKYRQETEGEYAGKKIFELERNGDFGLDPEHLSVTNMKGMMTAVFTLLLLLGALTFVLGTRDKIKKNNYF